MVKGVRFRCALPVRRYRLEARRGVPRGRTGRGGSLWRLLIGAMTGGLNACSARSGTSEIAKASVETELRLREEICTNVLSRLPPLPGC